jgi:RNA polymerase sigma-70 factor (ECF subfamily)
VLHDMFDLPFEEIAPLIGRSSTAARQLASRARRRVKGQPTVSDADLALQRELLDAFVAAAREGDFEALLAVLDPDVVLRADAGTLRPGVSRILRGAEAVARGALGFSRGAPHARPVLVNGAAGLVVMPRGRPVAVGGVTIRNGKIVAIDILADPERLRELDLTFLTD